MRLNAWKKTSILILLLAAGFGVFAFPEFNDNEKVSITPKRTLVWDDFKKVNVIQGKSTINALCLSSCDIEIQRVIPRGDHVQLEVKAIVKHKNDLSQVTENFLANNDEPTKAQVLHHENGHFLIAQIIGYRIVRDAEGYKFDPKNYKAQLNQIIRSHFRSWNQMDQLYDMETTKPRNAAMQQKWDEYFAKELAKLKESVN